jgi:hypothetical protein
MTTIVIRHPFKRNERKKSVSEYEGITVVATYPQIVLRTYLQSLFGWVCIITNVIKTL